VFVNVRGGGFTGQAGAIRQGVARALVVMFNLDTSAAANQAAAASAASVAAEGEGSAEAAAAAATAPVSMAKKLRDSGFPDPRQPHGRAEEVWSQGCPSQLPVLEALMLFLALESSCDETAAAVFTDQPRVLSSVVASQTDLHTRFGGVVPEVAARAHLRQLLPVVDEALRQAQVSLRDIGCIAVHHQPGLIGALLISVSAAKMFGVALGVPVVAVNHIAAHIYACQLSAGRPIYPCVGLVVSGGHTALFHCPTPLDLRLLGATRDDAAGEAFDKTAKLLGLGFPGGPRIERAAATGNPHAYRFPRSMLEPADDLDFSFSGLKTAVLYTLHGQNRTTPRRVAHRPSSGRSGREFSTGGRRCAGREMPPGVGPDRRAPLGGRRRRVGQPGFARWPDRDDASTGRGTIYPPAAALHRQRGDGGPGRRTIPGRAVRAAGFRRHCRSWLILPRSDAPMHRRLDRMTINHRATCESKP
jgi:tRNA threonylcarbamoyl adenosine modification protein TsaD